MNQYATNLQPNANDGGEPAWKAELNAKLAAHRQRRSDGKSPEGEAWSRGEGRNRAASGASRVAARVAERYAGAPSYSEMLAASVAAAAEAAEAAESAAWEASAAAQDASAAARDANVAAQGLLSDLHAQEFEERGTGSVGVEDSWETQEAQTGSALEQGGWEWAEEAFRRNATVEHPEPLPPRLEPPARSVTRFVSAGIVDAFAEATVPPAMSLPAKLIEFPRELIAARKARPHIAEGPLFEESAAPSALRIFEVAGEMRRDGEEGARPEEAYARRNTGGERATSQGWRVDATPGGSGWGSIRLGEHPVSPEDGRGLGRGTSGVRRSDVMPVREPEPATPSLYVASVGDRAMAALVDVGVVGIAFVLFLVIFGACTAHPPLNKAAAVTAGLGLLAMFILYGWLFMSYGGGTPGMRSVRIAVCTFSDENPSRRVLRNRVAASLLAVLPLGLGILWALFDEDTLGWHDRLTRSYQRSYR